MEDKLITFQEIFNSVSCWYHGTTSDNLESLRKGIKVDFKPRNCDFGIGFYMTSRKEQAEKWAHRRAKDLLPFNSEVKPVVLTYLFSTEVDIKRVKIFEVDSEFFDFIYDNRILLDITQKRNNHDFSMVFGPVIDGQIIRLKQTIEAFRSKKITLAETSKCLLGQYKDDTQLCICSQELANNLILDKEEMIC